MRRAVSLRFANSLRVESVAAEFVETRAEAELVEALDRARRESVPVTLLGGGTNVVPLGRIDGRVLRVAHLGVSFEPSGADVRVRAAGGEPWHRLVRACLGRGLAGLEHLSLIPGTVGAAPIQNIGAYGRELSSLVTEVSVVDTHSLETRVLVADACAFRYRDSLFKSDEIGRFVVTGIALELRRQTTSYAGYPDVARELRSLGRAPSPIWVAEAVTRVRRRKLPDPRRIGNVGSFFKNPTMSAAGLDRLRARIDIAAFSRDDGMRIPAARLIDACGWKGRRLGDAGVWPRHALVLVNHGNASGREILDLARRIQDDVARRFDVALELEPTVLGQD